MRHLCLAAFLFVPIAAHAQTVEQRVDSATATMTQIVAMLRGQIMADQRTIAELKQQLDAAKKPQGTPAP